MARIRITTYQNSLVASLLSLVGTCFWIFSGFCLILMVQAIFSGEFEWEMLLMLPLGVLLFAAGVGVNVLANSISERKAFRAWIRKIRQAGLEPYIASSAEYALDVYTKNPTEMTVQYIQALNPTAVAHIRAYQAACKAAQNEARKQRELESQSWTCSACGHKNAPNALYCEKCSNVK